MEKLADRVRSLIDKVHGGSVSLAARDIGLPQQTLDKIATGVVASPRNKALSAIANFYRCRVGWLIAGEGKLPGILAIDPAPDLPMSEFLRWLLLIETLDPSTSLRETLTAIPGATHAASAGTRISSGISEKAEKRFLAMVREAQRLEYQAWIHWLTFFIAVRGPELTSQLLERDLPSLQKRSAPNRPRSATWDVRRGFPLFDEAAAQMEKEYAAKRKRPS